MSGSIRILGRRGPSRQTAIPARAAGAAATDAFRLCILLTLCSVLAACAQSGDFGRPKPGVWNDVVLPATGAIMAARRGEPVSSFPLTDAEEELRDRSWRFLMPAHERSWFDRTVADLARTRVLPAREGAPKKTGYYRALTGEGWFGRDFASPASRFRRIGEDAEADLLLIEPFKAAAETVLAADEIRLRSLVYVRDLTDGEIADAAARVQENRCLIGWVRTNLQGRTEAYRYALEHAFIAMPQNEAAEAERTVRALDRHRRVLDTLPHADCSGRPTPHPVRLRRPAIAKG